MSFSRRSPLGRRLLPLCALLAAFSLTLSWAPDRASAQEAEAQIQLLGQPSWHAPGDRLNLRARVTNTGNTPLRGYRVRLDLYSAVEGRIELHDSFDGVSELVIEAELGPNIPPLAPGDSEVVVLDDRVSQLGLAADGVYPATLSVADDAAALASFTTQVVIYAERPEERLNLVPVIPIAGTAFRGPGGDFTPAESGETRIAEALDPETGWLRGLISALQAEMAGTTQNDRGGLGVGIAPSPRLLEELEEAATSYDSPTGDEETVRDQARAALDDLADLMATGAAQPLLSPYVGVDLPTLAARFDQEDLNRQLTEAEVVLEETVPDVTFDPRWFFAPGLRWDQESLGDVRLAGVENADHTFFTRHSISGNPGIGCPDVDQTGLAFACPVEIETEGRPVTGFVADPGVQERLLDLSRPGEERLDLQRFFAETAMVHLELPGTSGRVLQMSIPSQLQPGPTISSRLISGLTGAPWLSLQKPADGLRIQDTSTEKRDLTDVAPALTTQPEDEYFAAIDDAREAVEHFEEINPPDERVQSLHRNILVAQSRVWWTPELISEGMDFATRTQQEAEEELDNITIGGLDTTLTSQAAPIELTVFNNNTYPVTVDVELSSDDGDITIQRDDLAGLQDLTIGAEDNEQITVDAEAVSSGIFSLNAEVTTPQNGFGINEESIEIRSTNFNRIALSLTFGALAFLVLFYAWRWFKKHGGGATPSQQAAG